MARAVLALLLVALAVAAPPGFRLPRADAAEWGLIRPGVSTTESVRQHYGQPTRVERGKEQGYDVEDWIYEGRQAPAGIVRLVVHFGLLDGATFKRDVVRGFRLEPRKGSFNRKLIIDGWGGPDRETQQDNDRIMLFREGLLVYLDEDNDARLMLFSVPQPVR